MSGDETVTGTEITPFSAYYMRPVSTVGLRQISSKVVETLRIVLDKGGRSSSSRGRQACSRARSLQQTSPSGIGSVRSWPCR
jgi:hypothetical protein